MEKGWTVSGMGLGETIVHLGIGLIACVIGLYIARRKSETETMDIISALILIVVGGSEIAWGTLLFLFWYFPFASSSLVFLNGFWISA